MISTKKAKSSKRKRTNRKTITVKELIETLDKAYHNEGILKRIHENSVKSCKEFIKNGGISLSDGFDSGDGLADFIYNEITDLIDPMIRTGEVKTIHVKKYVDSDVMGLLKKASLELHYVRSAMFNLALKSYGKEIYKYLAEKAVKDVEKTAKSDR